MRSGPHAYYCDRPLIAHAIDVIRPFCFGGRLEIGCGVICSPNNGDFEHFNPTSCVKIEANTTTYYFCGSYPMFIFTVN